MEITVTVEVGTGYAQTHLHNIIRLDSIMPQWQRLIAAMFYSASAQNEWKQAEQAIQHKQSDAATTAIPEFQPEEGGENDDWGNVYGPEEAPPLGVRRHSYDNQS